jgi:hypothetical protein
MSTHFVQQGREPLRKVTECGSTGCDEFSDRPEVALACISNQLYCKLPNKVVILSEALRRSVA